MSLIIDPVRVFEVKPANASSGQVCTLLSAPMNVIVAANQQVIAGVAGKKIRIMGAIFQGDTAVAGGYVNTLDGSGGAKLLNSIYSPINTQAPFLLPVIDSGYAETTTGNGLFVTGGAQVSVVTFFYIIYTA